MKLGLVASGIQPTLHPVTALVRLLSLVAIADATPWRGANHRFQAHRWASYPAFLLPRIDSATSRIIASRLRAGLNPVRAPNTDRLGRRRCISSNPGG